MATIQKSTDQKTFLTKRILSIHPVVQFFIERLNISNIINNYIPQDARSALPLDKSLSILVHNILTASMPMYEISDWSKTVCEQSIGLEENESEFICDDRIGRALDKFYAGKHKDVFFRTAMKKNKIESLPIYPEGRPCFAPTFHDLERIFRSVEKYEVKRKEEVQFFPANLSSLQKKVLKLLDVPLSLYQ